MTSRWWSKRSGVELVDLSTRWPLYLLSASEPAVALLLLGAQPKVRVWGAAILLLVAVGHTVACVALLRAGISHLLGGPRPPRRLVGMSVALTALGCVAGVAAFRAYGQGDPPAALSMAMLFAGALTVAASPLLRAYQLLVVVVLPAAVAGIVQAATSRVDGSPTWAFYYVLWVGLAVFTYRPSVWFLSVVWEIHRSRDVQARLAVAEERLRFARDLHDVLGHNLALIAVNSELAAELVRRGQDGAVERMLEVRQSAQDSMREVREVVGGYRHADLDSELAGARSVLRSAGISTQVTGDGATLPRTAQAALGWVVREATTNIIRHSEPTTVTIDLDVVPDGRAVNVAILRIENDGARPANPGTVSGTGLIGLRERLAALGGDVDAQAAPGRRFVVQARLPLMSRLPGTAVVTEPMP